MKKFPCDYCSTVSYDRLRAYHYDKETMKVLHMCNICYQGENDKLDKIDLMLLQHPEMWGNDYPNAYKDIISWGSTMKNTLIGPVEPKS